MLVIVERHGELNFGGYCIESIPENGKSYVPFTQKLHFITDYREFNDLLINNKLDCLSYCTNTYNTGDEWLYREQNRKFYRIPYLKELLDSLRHIIENDDADIDKDLPPFDNKKDRERIYVVDDNGNIHLIYSDMYPEERYIPRNPLYKYFVELLFDLLNRFDAKHEIGLYYSRLKESKESNRQVRITESRYSFNNKDILSYREIINKFGITNMNNCTP